MRTGISGKLLAGTLMSLTLGIAPAQPVKAAAEPAALSTNTAQTAVAASQQDISATMPAEKTAEVKEIHQAPSVTTEEKVQEAASQPEADKNLAKPQKEVEVQLEYLQHRFFKNRHIDNYNIHLYKKWKSIHALSIYGGVTITGAKGYLVDDDQPGVHRNSDAFGAGPSILLRWEKHISGKLYADLDASGSLRIYGKAHPADGRAYDFLWRIGPRLTYRCTDDMAISLGYMYAHMSNGWHSHNPGYNGVGFSLGFQHRF